MELFITTYMDIAENELKINQNSKRQKLWKLSTADSKQILRIIYFK